MGSKLCWFAAFSELQLHSGLVVLFPYVTDNTIWNFVGSDSSSDTFCPMSGTNWMETNILKYYNLEKISLEMTDHSLKKKRIDSELLL